MPLLPADLIYFQRLQTNLRKMLDPLPVFQIPKYTPAIYSYLPASHEHKAALNNRQFSLLNAILLSAAFVVVL